MNHGTSRVPALIALALQALVGQAMAADTASARCDLAARWEDFAAISMTNGFEMDGKPTTMRFAMDVHDDGVHIVGDGALAGGPQRIEVLELERPEGHLVLASDPSGPVQLGEVAMVFELPLGVLKRQAASPCELRASTRYPVRFDVGSDAVSGEFELQGNSIHMTLAEQRGPLLFTYSGSVDYRRARGRFPTSTSIRGWTIFHGGATPENGEPSRFDTLADLPPSAFTPTTK